MTGKKRRDEMERIRALEDLEEDKHDDKTGILLGDEITYYAQNHKLISPFDPENIKPASYELTVGDEVMMGGKYRHLGNSTEESGVRIKPFDVAVIKTEETLNLPRFLIGRWNIRVRWAYEGLLWVGGPQVDPGYAGHLFCPIYNLSNKEVLIRRGDPIAVIDFVKTTRFNVSEPQDSKLRYQRPPSRVILEDYKVEDFRSALLDQANEIPKIKKDLKEGISELRNRVDIFTSLVFIVLTILIAAITLPYAGNIDLIWYVRSMDIILIALSLLAIGLAYCWTRK